MELNFKGNKGGGLVFQYNTTTRLSATEKDLADTHKSYFSISRARRKGKC
jgi:hypothetical protein